jgi:putative flippase GtrA
MSEANGPIQRLSLNGRTLLKEAGAFGAVGLACFIVDLGLFQWLYASVGLGAVTSKLVSTVLSMTIAYFAHRHWSFSHRGRTGLRREYATFFAVNTLTLVVGLGLVALIRHPLGHDSTLVLQLANVTSIAIGSLVRFVCYRKWVFIEAAPPPPVPAPARAAQPVEVAIYEPRPFAAEPSAA